jgi:hypothetical protein
MFVVDQRIREIVLDSLRQSLKKTDWSLYLAEGNPARCNWAGTEYSNSASGYVSLMIGDDPEAYAVDYNVDSMIDGNWLRCTLTIKSVSRKARFFCERQDDGTMKAKEMTDQIFCDMFRRMVINVFNMLGNNGPAAGRELDRIELPAGLAGIRDLLGKFFPQFVITILPGGNEGIAKFIFVHRDEPEIEFVMVDPHPGVSLLLAREWVTA